MGQKTKTDNICLCEYIGKLKGEEAKINDMNIRTIAYLQIFVRSYGLPNLPNQGFG